MLLKRLVINHMRSMDTPVLRVFWIMKCSRILKVVVFVKQIADASE